MSKILRIDYDSDVECPNAYESWQLTSFSRKHVGSVPRDEVVARDEYGDVYFKDLGLRSKHDVGLAFLLDYYQHSGSVWSLRGEGMQCPWDTARAAGMLVLPRAGLLQVPFGKGTAEARFQARVDSARKYLEWYNDWANGRVYACSLEDETGSWFMPPCGGFYGAESVIDYVLNYLRADDVVTIDGPASFLIDADDLELAIRKRERESVELEPVELEGGDW